MQEKKHFSVLDGLRGVAALIVLIFHIVQQHDLSVLPRAGFAVDFFYMLSGFVVAYAYEQRLQTGLSARRFMTVRLIRLYPLLFMGVSMGIALGGLSTLVTGFPSFRDLALASILGLLLLPSFVFPQWPTAYPFNMAQWSLFFELWINAVYAIIARYLTTTRLLAIVFVSGFALALMIYWFGVLRGGNDQSNWHLGFVRVSFPFFMGVLLYRIRAVVITSTAMAIGLFAAFSISLVATVPGGWVTDIFYLLVFFPVIVAVGARVQASEWLTSASLFMGKMSYPVYILQGSLLRLGAEIKIRLDLLHGAAAYTFDVAQFVGIVVAAYLALVWFDEPVRAGFSRRLRSQKANVPVRLA